MAAEAKGTVRIEGHELTVTNPEKELWPEQGITKIMYLQHLAKLAPYLLKYCRNRYLTTIRFPDGWSGKSFYQKKCPRSDTRFCEDFRAGIRGICGAGQPSDSDLAREFGLPGVSPIL